MPAVTGKTGMTVNSVSFAKQIRAFAQEYNLEQGEELTNQMRLWCVDNGRNFPPSLNMHKAPSETSKDVKARLRLKGSDRALGKRAVDRGIREVVAPLTPLEIRRAIPLHGEMEGKVLVRSETTGAAWLARDNKFKKSASTSDLERQHLRFRAKGRVKKGAVPNSSIGNRTMVNKLHVKQAVFRKYRSKKQKQVGKLKGGWVAGIVRFGGKVPAKWVNQHRSGGSAGGKVDKAGNGSLWAVNKVLYASHHKRISDFNFKRRPSLAIKAMEKKAKALARDENRRRAI